MCNRKIKFAVVGFGHIGQRHAEMIVRNNESELVSIIDINPVRLKEAAKYEVPLYHTLEDFLSADMEVDIINIATPNGIHAEQGLKVLESGNHLVVEKPMALNGKDAEKLISISKEKGKEIFCVMQNRYSPPSRWLKELIDSGVLGTVYMVQINCYWNRDERYYEPSSWHGTQELDGGPLFTQFSHFLDLMYWCFGDIKNINGRFRDFNHQETTDFEDSGFINFDFERGGVGSFNYSTSVYDKNLESSITIIAENGSVKIGGQYMNKVEYCHIKNYEFTGLEETCVNNDYGTYKGSAANHHFFIQNVIDVLNGKGKITADAVDGMNVVKMINKIYNLKEIK